MPIEPGPLLPCPFCGAGAEHIERSNPMSKWRHSVDCNTCGASGPVEATKEQAIAAWNQRTERPVGLDRIKYDDAACETVQRLLEQGKAYIDNDGYLTLL